MQGVEITENFFDRRHKFTNLLKSLRPPSVNITEITELLDHRRMAFLHLKEKLTLLKKTSKLN